MGVPVLGVSEEPWSSVPGCFTWRVLWSCFLHFLSFPMLLCVVFPSRPRLRLCPGPHRSLTKLSGVLAAPGRSRPWGGGLGVRLAPGPRGGLASPAWVSWEGPAQAGGGGGGGSVLLHSGAHGPHQGINPFHLLSLQGVWGVRPPPSPGVRGRRAEGKDVGSLLQPHKSRRINRGPPGVT